MTILDDTSRCPLGPLCLTCSARGSVIVTVETPVGVFCCTLCGTCSRDGGRLPVLGWAQAVRMSLDHCAHLGIDADGMARLMDASR